MSSAPIHKGTFQTSSGLASPITFANPLGVGIAPALNNRLVFRSVCWQGANLRVNSITDSLGNTWDGPLIRVDDIDGTDYTIFTALVTTSAALASLLVTFTGGLAGSNQMCFWCEEYSDLSTAASPNYLDGVSGSTGSSGTVTSGASSPAPASNDELAAGVLGDGGYAKTYTVGTGWTLVDNLSPQGSFAEGLAEDQPTVAGVGSDATSGVTGGGNWGSVVAVFQLSAAALAASGLPSHFWDNH